MLKLNITYLVPLYINKYKLIYFPHDPQSLEEDEEEEEETEEEEEGIEDETIPVDITGAGFVI